jgi:hypothetical protein
MPHWSTTSATAAAGMMLFVLSGDDARSVRDAHKPGSAENVRTRRYSDQP